MSAFVTLVQTRPQSPQLSASVRRFVSHPFGTIKSQFPYPSSHVSPQILLVQLATESVPAIQTLPQKPQLFVSVFMSDSHPLVTLLSQSENPELQVNPHVMLVQTGIAPATAGHIFLQDPQLLMLVILSQPLFISKSQSANPSEQLYVQIAFTHDLSVPLIDSQLLLQYPQFDGSVSKFISHPSESTKLQLSCPGKHVNPQCPPVAQKFTE